MLVIVRGLVKNFLFFFINSNVKMFFKNNFKPIYIQFQINKITLDLYIGNLDYTKKDNIQNEYLLRQT